MAMPHKGDRTAVLVKFPPDLLGRVEAFASEAGADRMAAIVELVRRGLGDDVRAAAVAERVAAGVEPVQPAPRASPALRELVAKSAPGSASGRPSRLVGFDPLTGAPLYREG